MTALAVGDSFARLNHQSGGQKLQPGYSYQHLEKQFSGAASQSNMKNPERLPASETAH